MPLTFEVGRFAERFFHHAILPLRDSSIARFFYLRESSIKAIGSLSDSSLANGNINFFELAELSWWLPL